MAKAVDTKDTPPDKEPVVDSIEQASIHLCNLVASGMSVEEAKKEVKNLTE